MTDYPPPPLPPRPVDPRELKPGRFWYWIAAIVIVVGIGAGFTVFAFGMSAVTGKLPDMAKRFAAGEATTVELSDKQDWAIYVAASGDRAPDVACESSDAGVTVEPSVGEFSYADGRDQWQLVYDVTVSKTGEYTFTCTSDADVGGFAVGDAVDVGGFVGSVFGSIGGLLGIPCVSIVVGGSIILIVALRRGSHKKKLRREARAPGAPGAW